MVEFLGASCLVAPSFVCACPNRTAFSHTHALTCTTCGGKGWYTRHQHLVLEVLFLLRTLLPYPTLSVSGQPSQFGGMIGPHPTRRGGGNRFPDFGVQGAWSSLGAAGSKAITPVSCHSDLGITPQALAPTTVIFDASVTSPVSVSALSSTSTTVPSLVLRNAARVREHSKYVENGLLPTFQESTAFVPFVLESTGMPGPQTECLLESLFAFGATLPYYQSRGISTSAAMGYLRRYFYYRLSVCLVRGNSWCIEHAMRQSGAAPLHT